ncbi:hypothetical protein D083_3425 [Dickeya solani RNS 08.23.3.1.A]|nr:hypothetical protein D083_3425 [Dickeya solani RNS 08.23.3.1.A]
MDIICKIILIIYKGTFLFVFGMGNQGAPLLSCPRFDTYFYK